LANFEIGHHFSPLILMRRSRLQARSDLVAQTLKAGGGASGRALARDVVEV